MRAETGAVRAGEHQMIDHDAIERLGGRSQAARRATVGLARSRITARMIMGEKDSGAAVLRRIEDDLPQREGGSALVPVVARDVKAMRALVNVGDPEGLAARVAFGEAAREERPGGAETIEL